jgi:hypothetical protein
MRLASRSGMRELQTKDPAAHVENVGAELHELVEHLRRDAGLVDDPQAAALFETSAEVIHGLEVAFQHFKAKSEPAWQQRKGAS